MKKIGMKCCPCLNHLVHNVVDHVECVLNKARDNFSFLALFGLRLYLAPVFITAGINKLQSFDNTVAWFAAEGWGLGLPFPAVLAALAIAAELLGGIALLVGLFTRLTTVPLMVTMLVAAFAVHWDNGWYAIAPSNAQTSVSAPLAVVGFPGAVESLKNSEAVAERLDHARAVLKEAESYSWVTEKGGLVVLNNGVEFAITYFLMLLVLFFYGGGKHLSLDYYLLCWLRCKPEEDE